MLIINLTVMAVVAEFRALNIQSTFTYGEQIAQLIVIISNQTLA